MLVHMTFLKWIGAFFGAGGWIIYLVMIPFSGMFLSMMILRTTGSKALTFLLMWPAALLWPVALPLFFIFTRMRVGNERSRRGALLREAVSSVQERAREEGLSLDLLITSERSAALLVLFNRRFLDRKAYYPVILCIGVDGASRKVVMAYHRMDPPKWKTSCEVEVLSAGEVKEVGFENYILSGRLEVFGFYLMDIVGEEPRKDMLCLNEQDARKGMQYYQNAVAQRGMFDPERRKGAQEEIRLQFKVRR